MTHYGVLDAMQSLAHWSVQFDSYEKANKAQIAKDCGGEQFYTDAIRPSELARIMHHAACFCTSVEQMRASDPSGWIGVRSLAVQRVWY
jgi:hypothetical protein